MTDSLPSAVTSQSLEEEDEEFLTPKEVLERMGQAWQNELASPCLLPSQMDIVDILLDQIAGMEENIAKQRNKVQLKISVHRMELQRISYITSDYVRTRLEKIEKNVRLILEENRKRISEGQPPLLSEQEYEFASNYADAEGQLFENTVLGFMPSAMQKVPVPREDLEIESVYMRVLEDNVEDVSLPDYTDPTSEIVVSLEKDSIHLIPFLPIKHLLEQGKVELL